MQSDADKERTIGTKERMLSKGSTLCGFDQTDARDTRHKVATEFYAAVIFHSTHEIWWSENYFLNIKMFNLFHNNK